MDTQKDFAGEKGTRIGMKYPKILIYILLLLFLSMLSPITAEEPVSVNSGTEKKEKDNKIEQAEIWNSKGIEYYKNKNYSAATECFLKAVELYHADIVYIINLTRAYCKDKKFYVAYQLINEVSNKFPKKEDQQNLQMELANVHFWWARKLEKEYDHENAINHYKTAYNIVKDRHPGRSAFSLYNIAHVYFAIGKKWKALEYYEKALPIWRTSGNRVEEARTLSSIGNVHSDLGQRQKALEYYKEALSITQAVCDRSGEAHTLVSIGIVYNSLGQKQEALEYCKKALSISQTIGDRAEEAAALAKIGEVYSALGQKLKALEYYEKALSITRTVGDRPGEVIRLNSIGLVYSSLGRKQKALECYEKALSIVQKIGYRKEEAITLNNMGLVYADLGQEQKALEYYKKALTINQEIGSRSGEATNLNNFANLYSALDQNQKALEYYRKALSIDQAVGYRTGEASTLHNIGALYLYSTIEQKQKALEYFKKALPIWRAVGDRAGEAFTLNNLGGVYSILGQKHKALKYYEKALPIMRETSQLPGEAIILNSFMSFWEGLKNIRLSIFYGKQSVNEYQRLRANISGLEKRIQKTYLENKKDTYRFLSKILISEGRLSEAQQVLDMLKEEEYFNFIRKDRAAASSLSAQVDFTEFEKQYLEKYNNVLEKLSSISSEYHLLKFKKNKNEDEKKQMGKLDLEMKKATKVYEEFLTQLKDAFDRYEKDKKTNKEDIKNLEKRASALRNTLKELDENEGGRHAALHYLVYKGGISVILTTPSGQLVKQTEFDENKFNEMVMAYRNFMMDAGRGIYRIKKPNDKEKVIIKRIKSYEKNFYDVMFKAVDEELKKYGVTNLVVSLDGVLRYLPLGALWDGENYLLQRYRIAIVTPFSLKNIKDKPVKEKRILGLGASQGSQELPPLPNVPAEIRFIVKDEANGYYGLIKGKAFIDDDFTRGTMIDQLRSDNYPLVHIASHFKFSPGDETKNHLLLGDGTTMKLSEIRRMGKLFNNVKLLVLSACQTGVGGNGEEIDGFGELAQQSGAKSVVASLWPVADESTKDLMLTFYGILKEGKVTGKIEALRLAQLELAGLEDLLTKDKNKTHQSNRQKTEYSHPYYWGPFIMMGNWR